MAACDARAATCGAGHRIFEQCVADCVHSWHCRISRSLKEAGFIEGKNVSIEYRWAEGRYDRLADLAVDLVSRHVAVVFAVGGSDPARVAKAATSTIPIVFVSAADPVKTGLVASLNRPEGNVTGVSLIGSALEAKRLELLHDLVPQANAIGVLINPNYPMATSQMREIPEAAARLGVPIILLTASTEQEIDAAFSSLVQRRAGALLVCNDPFFGSQSRKLVSLALQYALPTMYFRREFVEDGGIISYGPPIADGYHQAGVYTGKILTGVKTTDLPVIQPTKFELVINLKTARALNLVVPLTLLAQADDVIE
jgi:putative ABC transport system substrate-binding protein